MNFSPFIQFAIDLVGYPQVAVVRMQARCRPIRIERGQDPRESVASGYQAYCRRRTGSGDRYSYRQRGMWLLSP
jgi:hypothetical protein